jgi:hypothetical protein
MTSSGAAPCLTLTDAETVGGAAAAAGLKKRAVATTIAARTFSV